MSNQRQPWMVSLHGGHCGEFCDHAEGTLREMLEAAVAQDFHTYGVTEHAPRLAPQFLYPEEVQMGWDVEKIRADFERYAGQVGAIAGGFADRLTVLCGFEIEVVPATSYVQIMNDYRARFPFDYIVGSVHWVDELQIDGAKETFAETVKAFGGLEPLAVRYYETVAEMVEALRPEVVGHLDLIRKNADPDANLETPAIRRAALAALDAIKARDGILDVNTAGYRKGLDTPYPASWLVEAAQRMGIPMCFGDDSHRPREVGAGLERARRYLLDNGVTGITYLSREGSCLVRKTTMLL